MRFPQMRFPQMRFPKNQVKTLFSTVWEVTHLVKMYLAHPVSPLLDACFLWRRCRTVALDFIKQLLPQSLHPARYKHHRIIWGFFTVGSRRLVQLSYYTHYIKIDKTYSVFKPYLVFNSVILIFAVIYKKFIKWLISGTLGRAADPDPGVMVGPRSY